MKAKLVVENLNNFIPIYNIEVGQEYYAVDSTFPDSYPPEKVKVISIEKDISDMFDVDVMMTDGTIDSWYLEPTDNVFTAINEALGDILKPRSHEDILTSVQNLTDPGEAFKDALDDGNTELANLIYKNSYIKHGIISRYIDWLLKEYADNISTLGALYDGMHKDYEWGLDADEHPEQYLYNETEEEVNKNRKAYKYLRTLIDLPAKLKEKLEDFRAINTRGY